MVNTCGLSPTLGRKAETHKHQQRDFLCHLLNHSTEIVNYSFPLMDPQRTTLEQTGILQV